VRHDSLKMGGKVAVVDNTKDKMDVHLHLHDVISGKTPNIKHESRMIHKNKKRSLVSNLSCDPLAQVPDIVIWSFYKDLPLAVKWGNFNIRSWKTIFLTVEIHLPQENDQDFEVLSLTQFQNPKKKYISKELIAT